MSLAAIQNDKLKNATQLERKTMMYADDRPLEVWKLGTIIEFDDRSVTLEYDDGSREVVERGQGVMRFP